MDEGDFKDSCNGILVNVNKQNCWVVEEPFKASNTDIPPEPAPVSPETSTSSAAATGEVGSSPSDYCNNR